MVAILNGETNLRKKVSLPDIIYIMGTGRSGTTILEVLLTNNARIVGAGELKHIFRDGFLANRQCSCGHATLDCAMWSAVLRAAQWQHHGKYRWVVNEYQGGTANH